MSHLTEATLKEIQDRFEELEGKIALIGDDLEGLRGRLGRHVCTHPHDLAIVVDARRTLDKSLALLGRKPWSPLSS